MHMNESPSASSSGSNKKRDDDKFAALSNLTSLLPSAIRRDSVSNATAFSMAGGAASLPPPPVQVATFSPAGAIGGGSSLSPRAAQQQQQQQQPDLSYLTPEERAIIENVMHRQQDEESKEVSFLK